ncbi:hypothetical protein [Jeotgalibaca sp. A122]|uniref:hypothetical protein n=1 Tax=Jeotgalibaca sp. A122 TaxID=3457322 RepID=UPI003FD63611
MKKDKLRFLALGFFLSALIMTLFQLVGNVGTTKGTESAIAVESSIESSISSMKEARPGTVNNSEIESSQSSSQAESSESGNSQEESDERDSFEFIVNEGEPSSVVIENLYTIGLIEDPEEAQTYLEEHSLLNSIQYGTYELSKEMSDTEILDTLTLQ